MSDLSVNTTTVQIASNTNTQQVADGLPAYTIFANIPGGPQLPGPRSPGMQFYGPAYITDSVGFQLGGPQDPAPMPPVGAWYGQSPTYFMKPTKPIWEPSVYVQGVGWVNSATNANS